MAPNNMYRDAHLEAGLLKSSEEEKKTGYQAPGSQEYAQPKPTRKMSPVRKALLVLGVATILGLGVASARPTFMHCGSKSHDSKAGFANGDESELVKDLKTASPDVLHRLLHAYLPEVYQHGVYASDREAIEAIGQDNPSVAAALIKIAKRQDTGSSNTTTASSANVNSETSATSQPVTTSEVAAATTTTQASVTSNPVTTSATPTTSQPVTTSPEQTTSTPVETTSSVKSTSAAPTTSAPVTSAETPTPTPTSPETSTSIQKTITAGKKTTSSPVPHTFTSTLPDGGTITYTSTSWVAVVPTDQSNTDKSPDLQNDASVPRAQMALPAVLGLMAGAVLMI
ncbi:hypothetical protein PT974_07028 [Cladobotryum mycophilum]|uniref:Uncharacterized protein n=1 Tax=Cladobotryum mycophilum TaxID=491253 RepID=A0ABR0SN54_9HYPO